MSAELLLDVRDLAVKFPTEDGVVNAVSGLSFTLRRGETLGIVGESGSGKSVTNLAILGLLNAERSKITGEILLHGKDLLKASPAELRDVRGKDVAMIFQDPFACLHPMYRVGAQIAEAVRAHSKVSKRQAMDRAVDVLDAVGIPNARSRAKDYPHQFSGGMRQRAMIAMALVHNPSVLIADEPTTALDVTVQAQILELIDKVKRDFDIGVILITHDLGVVAETAQTVMVMYAGRAVEHGPAREVFESPQHPYTWGLLESMPSIEAKVSQLRAIEGSPPSVIHLPAGCAFHPRCPHRFDRCMIRPPVAPAHGRRAPRCLPSRSGRQAPALGRARGRPSGDRRMSTDSDALIEVEGLTKRFPVASGVFSRNAGQVHAVESVSLSVRRGETLGIVGESGCGKSTTARLMLKLIEPTAGTIRFEGRDITRLSPKQMRPLRREMQMVFQDPYSSLNPRHTVGQIIGQPYAIHKTEGDTRAMVRDLMHRCGMNPEHYNRYPHEFSGGQRQRIGVARALALKPKLIVCDEPVSALDVSIQAQILNLLESLQSEFDLTYIFISHDLSVIRQIADRIAVMYLGRVVELAQSEALYDLPRHPYTASLLSAVPRTGVGRRERIVLRGDVPSPVAPPSGCAFHPRCPKARLMTGGEGVPLDCQEDVPELAGGENGLGEHQAACWHPLSTVDELRPLAAS